jgi:hypothetical protein
VNGDLLFFKIKNHHSPITITISFNPARNPHDFGPVQDHDQFPQVSATALFEASIDNTRTFLSM